MEQQLLAVVDPDKELDVCISYWPHGRDIGKLAYYLCKFLVACHRRNGLNMDSFPVSMMRLIEAFQGGALSDSDVVFTSGGIVALKGVTVDNNGAIRCLMSR